MGVCRSASVLAAAAVVAVVVAACGDDATPTDGGAADAGGADAATFDGGRPSPIAAPALPRFTPCPLGWREVPDPIVPEMSVCDPWPESGHASCLDDEVHLPGTDGCTPIGPPCPADGWPADLPAGATIVRVRAGAVGGDGSLGAPFGTIGEAVLAAPDDAVIAIAPGAYEERIVVTRPASLVGACLDVLIRSTEVAGTIDVQGTTAAVRNVQIAGANGGVWAREATLTLDAVSIHDTNTASLVTLGTTARIDARDLVIRRARDAAVQAAFGSALDLQRFAIERAELDGIRAAGASVRIADAVITDIGTGASDGYIFYGSYMGELRIERTVIDPSTSELLLSLATPEVVLRDVVVRGPPLELTDSTAAGLTIAESGRVVLERIRLERMRDIAVSVTDPKTSLEMRDVLIRSVRAIGSSPFGHGIEVGLGATAVVERTRIEDARGFALFIGEPGTHAELFDVEVHDTQSSVGGRYGRAIQVQTGATLVGERLLLSGNHEATVVVAGPSASVALTDVQIDTTEPAACVAMGCTQSGVGLGAYLEASARLERFLVRGSALTGIQLVSEASVDLVDGEVSENPIGVNIQVPDYDIDRLTSRVYYRDNGTNLETALLPVPEPMVGPP